MYDIVRQSKLNEVIKNETLTDSDLELILDEFNTTGINGTIVRRLIDEIRTLKRS